MGKASHQSILIVAYSWRAENPARVLFCAAACILGALYQLASHIILLALLSYLHFRDMKFLIYFIICVLAYACSALRCQSAVSTQAPDLSRGTDVSNGKETPTRKPIVAFDAVELKRRQSSNIPTSSSHATCGYVNGSIS